MNVYQAITDRILEQLEKGTVPWRKPWTSTYPKNLVSKKEYRGINVLMLATAGYLSPYWATFRQINAQGGSVRKGEHATSVYFTSRLTVEDNLSGDQKEIPFLKRYLVFNMEQTVGMKMPQEEQGEPVQLIERCEKLIGEYQTTVNIALDGNGRAFYRPSDDSIHLPTLRSYDSAEGYYATLFHELVHSTGHENRLARKGITDKAAFGSQTYSQEELVAELGSAFLCGKAQIDNQTLEASASYVAGWLKALKDDKRMVVIAAAQAQKAVDHLLPREEQ